MNHLRPLKAAIAVYFWLLLLEGVLRKWVLPGFTDLLYVVRDPVVLVIYVLALRARVFPFRPAVLVLVFMALLSFIFALLNDVSLLTVLFGVRTDFLHLPLVFVMGATLDRDDVLRFGRWTLFAALPIVLLMWRQFNSSSESWLNVGAGGSEGGQLRGALGRIRPPGPFSFVSGVVAFFSLAGAFAFQGWMERGTYNRVLLWTATAGVLLAIPISISRSLSGALVVVVVFGLAAVLRDLRNARAFLGLLLFCALAYALVSNTDIMDAYRVRWEESMQAGNAGFSGSVVWRLVGEFTGPFKLAGSVPFAGHGIGVGTLAGARLATGKVSFLLAESELSRVIMELGPMLGFAFIAWRVWLALLLVRHGLRAIAADGNALPWLLASATIVPVVSGQWGQNTSLGFAVFVAGLSLGALNLPEEPWVEEEASG